MWYTSRYLDLKAISTLQEQSRPPYRAPSWSWASVDTPVRYHHSSAWDGQSHIIVHGNDTFCDPVLEGDQTGAVASGQITIEGALVPVELMTRELPASHRLQQYPSHTDEWSGRQSFVRGPNGYMEQVCCDVIRPVQLRIGDAGYECWSLENHWCEKCRPSEGWDNMDHCCLNVASLFRRPTTNFFLLLERSKQKGTWERVGIGRVEIISDARRELGGVPDKRQRRREKYGLGNRWSSIHGDFVWDGESEGEATSMKNDLINCRLPEMEVKLFKDARVQKVRII